MTFSLRLDGEVIASVPEQVTGVRVQTARGESSVTGISPSEGVVDIILDRVAPGGPPRLDQIEAQQMQDIRDRAEEGMAVGFNREHRDPQGLMVGQGLHDETLRPGGVNESTTQTGRGGPAQDLMSGLTAFDVDTINARLDAFNKHGDSGKAIKDNPPGNVPSTAEQGATSPPGGDEDRDDDPPKTRGERKIDLKAGQK